MSFLKIYYASDKYNFESMILSLYNIKNLQELHLLDKELGSAAPLEQKNEAETYFHDKFYSKLRNGWKEIEDAFEKFVADEVSPLFDEDFLYQVFPSFRVQVPNQTAVSKWHYDSDEDHGHPDWEINFQIALTKMQDSSACWIETVPGLGDFSPMNLELGEFVIFNGNKCRHGNHSNETGKTRVSFDFRVLPINRYDESTDKSSFYGRKFVDGEYYKRYRKRVNV
jgi:ectoine hydroxylase-related dioxygenase (phytanoyl-CoA dioxygenase family)